MRLRPRTLILAGLVAALVYGGVKVVSAYRGIRNNNPGNIRLSGTIWQGQVAPADQTDDEYVQFTAPEYGIRAMARILSSYAGRGITTLAGIISSWAPPTENDTVAYIQDVADRTGLDPSSPVDRTLWPQIIAAIIHHENGIQPYDSATLARGVNLA